MSATINTFPPFQSMNSPRGWILAVIVLLHLGFFWLLSSGMGHRLVEAIRPPPVLVDIPTKEEPIPEKQRVDAKLQPTFDPTPRMQEPTPPQYPDIEPIEPSTTPIDVGPPVMGGGTAHTPDPVITHPDIDARIGLSEPVYPAADIRAGHAGTVLLSVYVLENGRIGDVRLDQSSGFKRLDDSALREARQWRLKPGMRDGIPVAMWKQIPITFRLQEDSRRF